MFSSFDSIDSTIFLVVSAQLKLTIEKVNRGRLEVDYICCHYQVGARKQELDVQSSKGASIMRPEVMCVQVNSPV